MVTSPEWPQEQKVATIQIKLEKERPVGPFLDEQGQNRTGRGSLKE